MKARGNVKTIIEKIGKVQNLVGRAKALHDDDRSPNAHEKAQNALDEAFELCLEIRNMYDPID
jgi:hypothetical protein